MNWAREQLPELTQQVVQGSGINQPSLAQNMDDWVDTVSDAEDELNRKTPPPTEPAPQPNWPPLPGVAVDNLCVSVFDANDLALRGTSITRHPA